MRLRGARRQAASHTLNVVNSRSIWVPQLLCLGAALSCSRRACVEARFDPQGFGYPRLVLENPALGLCEHRPSGFPQALLTLAHPRVGSRHRTLGVGVIEARWLDVVLLSSSLDRGERLANLGQRIARIETGSRIGKGCCAALHDIQTARGVPAENRACIEQAARHVPAVVGVACV